MAVPVMPGQVLVQLEEVLDGDRGDRLRLFLDLDVFLGLDRLVQAVGPLPAVHEPARELVDDDDLALDDGVVAVALVDGVGAQRVLDHVRPVHVGAAVEAADAHLGLGDVDALVGQVGALALALDDEVLRVADRLGLILVDPQRVDLELLDARPGTSGWTSPRGAAPFGPTPPGGGRSRCWPRPACGPARGRRGRTSCSGWRHRRPGPR